MKRKYSRAKIVDEFTDLVMSRQRKYQLRRHKEGMCIKCGKPRCSAYYCLDHMIAAREALRIKTGAVRRLRSKSYRLAEALKAAKSKRLRAGKSKRR